MSKKNPPNTTISVKVSNKSASGWKEFCNKNGITLSAFIEIAGLELLSVTEPLKVKERNVMVEKARVIDQQRRIRKK